jgi:arylsulfatase A-like enzyme
LQHGTITVKTNGTLNLDETTIADVLKENGYTNYMYGKWNLGNASPRELPTARGFHQFVGFLASEQDYWSKHTPSYQEFRDFLYADTECYYMYDGDDLNHYSTNLYREKAIATIQQHDFDSSPMFMYLSMQAPHAPFADLDGTFPDGIPKSYVDPVLFDYINSTMVGQTQKQYYLSLNIMDGAVKDIYTALEERGQAGRTYIIFASDNGGCPTSGGRNTPLRGGKSTLFEGGTLVESFLYSPGLPATARGRAFDGLFHVSDWFPTILGLTDTRFTPKTGFELDGFDQSAALLGDTVTPRDYVLYNYYYNVDGQNYEFFTRGGGAIRNSRFKLLHTYLSSEETWFYNETVYQNDDNLSNLLEVFCSAPNAVTGNYTYFLFDLDKDPEERVNLYDTNEVVMAVQQELYDQLMIYALKSNHQTEVIDTEETNLVRWHENGDYITPWIEMEGEDEKYASKPFPRNCGMLSTALSSSSSSSDSAR